jgi:hypothetical protein
MSAMRGWKSRTEAYAAVRLPGLGPRHTVTSKPRALRWAAWCGVRAEAESPTVKAGPSSLTLAPPIAPSVPGTPIARPCSGAATDGFAGRRSPTSTVHNHRPSGGANRRIRHHSSQYVTLRSDRLTRPRTTGPAALLRLPRQYKLPATQL